MRKSEKLVLAALLFLLVLPLSAADGTEYTLKSNVGEVRIAFSATDLQGRVITKLNSADVAVVDNGDIIRRIRSFRSAEEVPLNIMVLVDASGSMAAGFPHEIEAVKQLIAGKNWGAKDRVSILAFGGSKPEILCAVRCAGDDVAQRLRRLNANGTTPLYDALLVAAEFLAINQDVESRSALVLFSDGRDTISMGSAAEAVAAAQAIDAPIYAVNTRSEKPQPDGDRTLKSLSAATGGLVFAPGSRAEEVLAAVVDDLHRGFVLTYALPRRAAAQHTVLLLPVSNPQLRIRSRQSYRDAGED